MFSSAVVSGTHSPKWVVKMQHVLAIVWMVVISYVKWLMIWVRRIALKPVRAWHTSYLKPFLHLTSQTTVAVTPLPLCRVLSLSFKELGNQRNYWQIYNRAGGHFYCYFKMLYWVHIEGYFIYEFNINAMRYMQKYIKPTSKMITVLKKNITVLKLHMV